MDRALVERARDGDREAYEALARAVARDLYLTAHRIVRDPDRADDAAQQALITIWRDLPSLRDLDRFSAWSYRIVVRHCHNADRRRRRAGVREVEVLETQALRPGQRRAGLRRRDPRIGDRMAERFRHGRTPSSVRGSTKYVRQEPPRGEGKGVAAMRIVILVLAISCVACGSASIGPVTAPSAATDASPSGGVAASPTEIAGASATASPASSREGDWLVFEWFAGRSVKDVMLMRPDGSERHAVGSDIERALHHAHPTWSPDGSTIAFDVGELYDGVSIWTVGIDGADAAKLIGPDDRCPLGVAFPSYSPDGRRLMYACQAGGSGTSPDVHETLEILDLASGDRTAVITLEGQQEIVWPTWSRDGETALFTVNTWAEDLTTQVGSFIATVPIGGGRSAPLMDADTWATEARWSPTQDLIVFGTHGYDDKSMATRSTIETIRPDASGRQMIWPGSDPAAGRVGSPRWSVNGERLIVSVATGEDRIADIHPAMLSLDGQLSTIAAPSSGVHWSPRPGQ